MVTNAVVVGKILQVYRAERSCAEVNRLAAFEYDKVSRWERGERHISWEEFFGLARLLAPGRIEAALASACGYEGQDLSGSAIARFLMRDLRMSAIARTLQCSRATLKRWTEPGYRVPAVQIFGLIEVRGAWHSFLSILLAEHCSPNLPNELRVMLTRSEQKVEIQVSVVTAATRFSAEISRTLGLTLEKHVELESAIRKSIVAVQLGHLKHKGPSPSGSPVQGENTSEI